jgi:chromosome segregation ATPase
MASQGELAIATMAVSFAILLFAIKQSGMRYNIVYCDEIDAELDIDNRLMFKYILEQQLEDLKVEQCFIVSHNESFNDQECYSVLLSKNDFTSKFKRNVLFSAFDKKKKLK